MNPEPGPEDGLVPAGDPTGPYVASAVAVVWQGRGLVDLLA